MKDASLASLKKAAKALSERYRNSDTPYLRSQEDRKAYLITRLPATESVLARVFQEVSSITIESYLDIGSGPGSSWYPAKQQFPHLKSAEFIEIDKEFVRLGKERLKLEPIVWKNEPAGQGETFSSHDCVLFSYSWGEILSLSVLEKALESAKECLIIIEPGTPKGFRAILKARDMLLQKGAHIIAPCPHKNACPLKGDPNSWCHFGVRLERSWEHQWMKDASLGYEDEKYSYLIVSKKPRTASQPRLLKNPLKLKGHLKLTLCTDEGIKTEVITKSENALFKRSGKLEWGDTL